MGNLTDNFSWEDFIVSAEHPDLLEEIKENFTESDRVKCYYLARMFLQPMRDTWKEPITILSGKRSPLLNTSVNGTLHSDHLFFEYGAASDFTAKSIKQMGESLARNQMPFGQMIWYPDKNFIHISLPTPKHYRETLTKVGQRFYPFGQEPKK